MLLLSAGIRPQSPKTAETPRNEPIDLFSPKIPKKFADVAHLSIRSPRNQAQRPTM